MIDLSQKRNYADNRIRNPLYAKGLRPSSHDKEPETAFAEAANQRRKPVLARKFAYWRYLLERDFRTALPDLGT
jgi:hypothetical protein